MTSQEFRQRLKRLPMSQNAFARLLSIDPRTARRYADPDDAPVPGSVAILLRLLARRKITAEDIEGAKR